MAVAARFWIGTSGWHYAPWRGGFYPEGPPPAPRGAPGGRGGIGGALPGGRPPAGGPPGAGVVPVAAQLPSHAGERAPAGRLPGAAAEGDAARLRVPPRLLAVRRLPRFAAAVRRRLLRLRHAGPGVPADGDGALRLRSLPRQ